MTNSNPLPEPSEAFEIIKRFNHLNASRAPIKDFMPIIDVDNLVISIRNTNILFKGIAGLADHQIGKLHFFDQSFECELIGSEISGNQITIMTKGVWHARRWQYPAANSQQLIADLTHTWVLERKAGTGPFVICTHICESFAYRDNFSPHQDELDFHLLMR